MYDQLTVEQEVSKELDVIVEKQKRDVEVKRLNKQLSCLDDRLHKIRMQLDKTEAQLSDSMGRGLSDRRLRTFLDQQEALVKEQRELQEEQAKVEKDLKDLDVFDDVLKHQDDSLEEGEIENETEQEKSIRLGQMTAFGKVLVSRSNHNDGGVLSDYVKDWMDTSDGEEDSTKKKATAKSTRFKDEDDEIDEEIKQGWGTDDSDWESSSSSEELVAPDLKRHKKRREGQTVDDGDRDMYLDRLQEWQETETDELASKYEELEGGLRVPAKLWGGLYHYQKVAVQWLWELHQQQVGGILGDEMGLGKTIQLAVFLASLSYSSKRLKQCRLGPCLIVCPTTVMHQWVRELHLWWPPFRVCILHSSGSHQGSRDTLIRTMGRSNGILVTSYSGVLSHKDELLGQNFDYVVLDEGHKIRNPDAQVTLAVKQFATAHRLILSGSPLQNNLRELWSLFDFIYPGKLGTLPVFMAQFSVPITMGGYSNATRSQVATAHKCATVLRDTINPYLLRRLKSDVKSHINLPAKNEQVLFCRLTDVQRDMYRTYINSTDVKNILDGRLQVFLGLIALRKMCNHPDLYDGGPKNNHPSEADQRFGYWKRSGKMIVVEALLKLWKKQGHKVLLFTQSRKMLTILQAFLHYRDYSHVKLDGSTPIASRQTLIHKFNTSPDLFVFVLTTRVGGLGVNLTGANRVVIFDPDWNPSTDTQARERAWRIGQNKDVTIYRLLTSGTIEEKIYHRQIFKQMLVNRVLKDPTQKRFFKSTDLYDLFTLNEGTSDKTETSAIFAGTNSEVDVVRPPKKRSKKRPSCVDDDEPRQAASKPLTKVPKKIDTAKVLLLEDTPTASGSATNDELSEADRQRLREKVRLISQKFGKRVKKSKKRKDARFEGERVPHLVKSDVYKTPQEEGQQDNEEGDKNADDDYVLSRLFKKSGVHSALKHDVIMNSDGADFALIDAEAERVAKEAVKRLRDSRRQCFRAEAGIPTWTGTNGAQNQLRFGKKKSSALKDVTGLKSSGPLSASELLHRMRGRNRLIPSHQDASRYDGHDLFQPDNQAPSNFEQNVDLLADIRNFVAFQNDSAGVGEATTEALVEQFKDKLPPVKNPLFKALLNEICSFHKYCSSSSTLAGKGVWRLKQEFR